jgi:RNA-directed DNA polymerase
MLKAGYLEDWKYHDTLSGAPQGSLCSAEHKEPYEQRRIMPSAGLFCLVRGGPVVERCA